MSIDCFPSNSAYELDSVQVQIEQQYKVIRRLFDKETPTHKERSFLEAIRELEAEKPDWLENAEALLDMILSTVPTLPPR